MIDKLVDVIRFNRKKFIIIISIFILNIFLFGSVLLTVPRIDIGDSEIELDVNNLYKEPGYESSTFFKDVSSKVKVSNNINNKKVGKYYVDYKIKYLFFIIKNRRVVNVVDKINPDIVLKGKYEISICPNKEYVEEGFNAIDNYDGDLTKNVVVSKKDDKIIYKVVDSSGNKVKKVRKVLRKDTEKPIIKLNGSDNVIIYSGSNYKEPGFVANDNCDGDITNKVEIIGTVNSKVVGKNAISYKVVDSSGNETKIVRNVVVRSNSTSILGNGVIYLTFDDGPSSSITSHVLDILKEEGVKATFFLVNRGDNLNYLIKREHNEGHTVALHSNTHNYSIDYASNNAYLDGLSILSNKVKSITGVDSKIIRFPGGSSNTISKRYTKGVMTYLTGEVTRRGYKYFDWNVDSDDAGSARTKNDVFNNVTRNLSHSKTNIVLMHDYDGNNKTLDALRDIIKYGKDNGYSFSAITMDTPQIKHGVSN